MWCVLTCVDGSASGTHMARHNPMQHRMAECWWVGGTLVPIRHYIAGIGGSTPSTGLDCVPYIPSNGDCVTYQRLFREL